MFDRQRCSHLGTGRGSTAGQCGEDGKITGNAGIHGVYLCNTRALLAAEFRGVGKSLAGSSISQSMVNHGQGQAILVLGRKRLTGMKK